MRITRRLEFDSGHRIPDHQSQCRHLHGHRYAIEITLQGDIIRQAGSPLNGMVMDFSDIKTLAKQNLVDAWDHAFLVWRGDSDLLSFLESLPGHKAVVLEVVPTAENLAALAFALPHELLALLIGGDAQHGERTGHGHLLHEGLTPGQGPDVF